MTRPQLSIVCAAACLRRLALAILVRRRRTTAWREGALKVVVDCQWAPMDLKKRPGHRDGSCFCRLRHMKKVVKCFERWMARDKSEDRGQSQSWSIVKKERKEANRPTQGAREGWEDGTHAATTQGF